MQFTLFQLRYLHEKFPAQAGKLEIPIKALESAINDFPSECLSPTRALFETALDMLATAQGQPADDAGGEGLPALMKRVIGNCDFSVTDHPDAEKIAEKLKRLVGSMTGCVGALAELSNIRGFRHGATLDWSRLYQEHARLLGGLCDSVVSLLLDLTWSRLNAEQEEQEPIGYGQEPEYDQLLDELHNTINLMGEDYEPSRVLYYVDVDRYLAGLTDFKSGSYVGSDR